MSGTYTIYYKVPEHDVVLYKFKVSKKLNIDDAYEQKWIGRLCAEDFYTKFVEARKNWPYRFEIYERAGNRPACVLSIDIDQTPRFLVTAINKDEEI
jgi:hypothetical protein